MGRETERFAVERTVYDRDQYYSDECKAEAKENLSDLLDGEDATDDEVFDEQMRMMESDEERELAELRLFMAGGRCESSGYRNPYGGNEIIARGASRRWDGESNGFITCRDLDGVLSWDGIFKDCELASIRDVNGSLYIEGTHHDGGVLLEVRQLSDEGQKVWDELYGDKEDWYFPSEGLDAMGKTYMYGDESEFLRNLWDDETLCPRVGYLEKMYGNPAESYEHDGARVDVNRAADGSAYEVTKAAGDGERCRVGTFGSLREARDAVDEVARGWGRRAARAR